MLRVTLKGIWAHKLRFVSTTVAIVLGVGFMAGTYVFTDTIGRTFNDLFSSVYQGTDTVVRTKKLVENDFGSDDRRERLPAAVLDEVRAVPSVERADGFVRGYAQLVKRSNKPLGGRNAPTFGVAWIDDARLNPFRIASGRAPSAADEISIDKASARLGEFKLGDSVKVLSQSATASYTVVGIMTFGSADSPAAASAMAFTPAQAAKVFETNGALDSVLVVGRPGTTQESVTAEVAAAVGSETREVLTGAEVTKQTQSELKKRLRGFTVFLTAFAFLALFVGMFVISNTFSILVAQRTRELALLRAIGAGRRQVLTSVMLEALVIGVIASVVGLGAGIGLAVLLKAAFAATGLALPGGSLVVLGRTVVVSLILGTVITVVSALIPAWRAGRVPPLAAIREISIDRSASSRARFAIGAGLAALDVALILKGLSGNGSPLTEGAAFALAIVTVTVLGPAIARPVGRLLGWPLKTFLGMPGTLAQQNAVRNPRRTARTAMALTIGVAVVAMVLTFVASFNGLITRTVDGQFKADYIITNKTFTGFSPEVARKVALVPGVQAVSGVRFGRIKIAGKPEFVAAFDTAAAGELVELPVVAGEVSKVVKGSIALSDKLARDNGWKLGDAIDVVMPTGPTSLTIDALMDNVKLQAITQGGSAIISLDTYSAGFTESLDFQVYVKAEKGADLDAVSTAIEAALVDYPTAEVLDQAEYKRSISDQLNQFVVIIFILLALSVVIALFGVANTLLLSIHERTREIGLLRAVGMTRAQVRTTVRWESVIMAVLGVLLGLALGVVFGLLIMRSLRDDGFTETVVPVGSLVVITIIGMVFGVVAGIRPARKAAKLDVLRAIGAE